MTKNLFFLLACFFFVCFNVFGESHPYIVKIIHEDLVLSKTLSNESVLEKKMKTVLRELSLSLRENEEYSKDAVSKAIAFINSNKTTTQAFFVKFCLGYYLSEISMYCAGRRDVFVEMIEDSSKIFDSIIKSSKDSWEAQFIALTLSKKDQILIRDADPDYGNNPKTVEIYIVHNRKNIENFKKFDLMEKDKNYSYFEKTWLKNPYTEEFARCSIIVGLIYLNKKDEAEKEFNNFKTSFPNSKHQKDLEKLFLECSKPEAEKKEVNLFE